MIACTMSFNFQPAYPNLPATYTATQPTPVKHPKLFALNPALANDLAVDIEWLQSAEGLAVLSGQTTVQDSIATVYAGHQFGQWNPQLGDGRVVLLGKHVTPSEQPYEIQLKGAGPTPYSRGGDGRSPLGPVIREYLLSEAMHVLGVLSTRALAAIATGESVWRNEHLAGGLLVRVASSHLRIGTLQYFSAKQAWATLRDLVTLALARHYPEHQNDANPALSLFNCVVNAQAQLVSQWQCLGFVHGVMNTDNMLLSGATIDYGPCAFMDTYHPETVFSSIDHQGRYAYQNQPAIAHWNLAALADALIPIAADEPEIGQALLQESLDQFPERYLQHYYHGMRKKLGLNVPEAGNETGNEADDKALIDELLKGMQTHELDFTLSFRYLADLAIHAAPSPEIDAIFAWPDALSEWQQRWLEQLQSVPATIKSEMLLHNPAVIPRNHQVERAIQAAYKGDMQPFVDLHAVLQRPAQLHADYLAPPQPEDRVYQTFCGT